MMTGVQDGGIDADKASAAKIRKILRAVHHDYTDEEIAQYARELYQTQAKDNGLSQLGIARKKD